MVFTYTLRDFYKKRAESNDKGLLQEKINDLIQLIYDELKKPSASYVNYNSNSNRINRAELKDKRRVIGHIGLILGLEKMKELYEKKNFNELLFPKSVKREVMGIICVFASITVIGLIVFFLR